VHINQWPPYVYFPIVITAIFLGLYLIVIARRNKAPLAITIIFASFILSMLCIGSQKALLTYSHGIESKANILGNAGMALGAIGIFLGFFISFKYGNERVKKMSKWVLFYLAICAIFVASLFIAKHLGYIR